MFKVICINSTPTFPENKGKLKEGETYTVIGDNADGDGYLLAEVKNHYVEWGFDKRRFVPLFSIDEIAHLEERADQEIANLDRNYRDLVHQEENAQP